MIELIVEIFDIVDFVVGIIFFFVPSFLRLFSLSLLILVIGAILNTFNKIWLVIMKWIMYLLYFIYSLWVIGLFSNLIDLLNYTILDWAIIITAILGPICIIIVGRKFTRMTIKSHRIFNSYIYWIIYLVFSCIWVILYPEEVLIGLVFVFASVSYILIYCFKHKSKRVEVNDR
nr:MAG: hypothetical protein [uncultured archaeon]